MELMAGRAKANDTLTSSSNGSEEGFLIQHSLNMERRNDGRAGRDLKGGEKAAAFAHIGPSLPEASPCELRNDPA
jgi:hypothetical protein